jgi:glycosyltransferase involved in cell wall biosynthesis
MKIHIHTPSFFPDLVGMTYATHVHASLLSELGADVTVVAPAATETTDGEAMRYRVRRFDVRGSGMPWNRLRGELAAMLDFNERERPDIVIAEGWFTPGAVLLPRLKRGARHAVLSSHGSADLMIERMRPAHIARSLAYRLEEATRSRSIMRSLSAALVLSTWEDRLRFRDVAWFRRAGVPLYVCPNSSTYTPAAGHALRPERVDLIHIGEMKPHKAPETAVRVVAELPHRFHLTLAFPRETPHLARVQAYADALGVRDRLRFVVGRKRSELEEVVAACDLLLITSPSKDVQPIVAVDALAKGLPFVSTDVGCMREFGGGVVARADEMAAAVARICADERSYRQYSLAACRYRDEVLAPGIARRTMARLMADLDI